MLVVSHKAKTRDRRAGSLAQMKNSALQGCSSKGQCWPIRPNSVCDYLGSLCEVRGGLGSVGVSSKLGPEVALALSRKAEE